jgi:hypothetical protein
LARRTSPHLKQALEQDRTLFELDAIVQPMSDLGLYLAGAADWPSYERHRAWRHPGHVHGAVGLDRMD